MIADNQRERLYEWERAFVDARWPPETMSSDEIATLVMRVAVVLGIKPPAVRFTSMEISCKARPHINALDIADWGRTRPVVLHEMAHLGTWEKVMQGDEPHGRAFTALVIALYHRFLGMPLDYLVESALSRRLVFDPLETTVLLAPTPPVEVYEEDF